VVQLKVGGWYRTRNGLDVQVIGRSRDMDKDYPFVAETKDGFELQFDSDGDNSQRDELNIIGSTQAPRVTPVSREKYFPIDRPTLAVPTPKTSDKGSSMNSKRLMGSMFGGPVGKNTDSNVRLSFTGGLAVRAAGDTNYVAFQAGGLVDVFDFAVEVDGFLYNMPSPTVAPGDLILASDNSYLFVVKANEDGTLIVLNPVNSRKEFYEPTANIFFGKSKNFIKVSSLLGNLGGGDAAAGGFNPMMLMMLSGKDGEKGGLSDKLLPLLMMQGAGGAAGAGALGGINPMMLMMMGKDGGSSDMMETMLMAQAFGGGNFGGGLFGAPAPKA